MRGRVIEHTRIFSTESWLSFSAVVVGLLTLSLPCRAAAQSQSAAVPAIQSHSSVSTPVAASDLPPQLLGLSVREIRYTGVAAARLARLIPNLAQQTGAPLNEEKIAESMRQLFATGLYDNLQVVVDPDGINSSSVVVEFRGQPRTFIGTLSVDGAKGATMNAQLEQSSELVAGTRFTQAKMDHAIELMRQTMVDNGFHQSVITPVLTPHPADQLVDIGFHVVSGLQARVGEVTVSGDSDMDAEDFRRAAHLRAGSVVSHDTNTRALASILNHYRKENRLEAEIKLESHDYSTATNQENDHFSVNRGPIVHVLVNGVKLSNGRIRRIIPVFQEGAVDEDLLNEGNHDLRDYYQRRGFFSVKVEHQQPTTSKEEVLIQYTVHLGPRRRVERVDVTGNHYFDSATLKQELNVRAADSFDRHGSYSQALLATDVAALEAIYQSNGFAHVKVTAQSTESAPVVNGKQLPLKVVYSIEEGLQQRVSSVQFEGAKQIAVSTLTPIINTAVGQPLSPQGLAADRDALITYYLSHGFDLVRVEVAESADDDNPEKIDVIFRIHEDRQIFVRNVLITGLHYTRPQTIARAITLKPGDPLNETALAETQRNLYEFALFNQVDTAIENPTGEETLKTVLIQAVEARRWTLTYGLGFEVQTGTCGIIASSGSTCGGTNGQTGASPRVLLDITRSNLFGRDQSLSLRGNYGLLEQKINLLYQTPRLLGSKDFGIDISGGYANSQDVTTYVSSMLDANIRLSQHFRGTGEILSRANTFVYELAFRRVKVAKDSLQVEQSELTELSTAVRVSGPGFTWIRDTRDSPLDAHRGTYSSFQEFISNSKFGAEAQFNRIDLSNSGFYAFDKGHFVIARNTRYGQERVYGSSAGELIPLPERLYAGGANSLRGFGSNAAGPRDPQTGYPIGGAGVFANTTEFRLPAPTLPWLDNTLSFVLFHDMGNVFTNAGDIWASAIRSVQPNRETCRTLTQTFTSTSTGEQGACSFNYFDHAVGLGLRYHTPVGPVRLDFSYNINPPIYPVCTNCTSTIVTPPQAVGYTGQGAHFNFFFSLGQAF